MSEPLGTGILLLSCPDRRGLVAAVSDFLFSHGANILHADQHTDQEEGIFLQRVEFELDGMDVRTRRSRDGIRLSCRSFRDALDVPAERRTRPG